MKNYIDEIIENCQKVNQDHPDDSDENQLMKITDCLEIAIEMIEAKFLQNLTHIKLH